MLFNSVEFIFLLLPLGVTLYYFLLRKYGTKISQSWLLLLSAFFYAYWNVSFLPILLGSIAFNFLLGSKIQQSKKPWQNRFIRGGIVANVSLLLYFKYSSFIVETVNSLLGSSLEFPVLELPLAISFFTFQQIAYLVDSAKMENKPSLFNYSLFVGFFPQLIAGPIVHHKEMMQQFSDRIAAIPYHLISKGIFIFSMGLAKKVLIADQLSPMVHQGFDLAPSLTFAESWISSIAYSFQLYFDFSGYTDMAWGAALLFGIQLPQNFDSPYKAFSIQNFWRRWHITLSRFLRDYLYIPLGGNKNSLARTLLNLFLTFLIGGLWHGAAWTFVVWGALHGLALVVERIVKHFFQFSIPRIFSIPLTFLFVNFAWVFFRATSFNDAKKVFSGLVSFDASALTLPHISLGKSEIVYLLIAGILAFFGKNSNEWLQSFTSKRAYLYVTIILFIVSVLHLNRLSEFIYFQF